MLTFTQVILTTFRGDPKLKHSIRMVIQLVCATEKIYQKKFQKNTLACRSSLYINITVCVE